MSVSTYIKRKLHKFYNKIVLEKAPPEYIARGWAIGMFFGCTIPFGLQLLCSIPCSFLFKGSKIGATLGTLITNHFTILIIYPVQCWIGNHIIGGSMTLDKIKSVMQDVLKKQEWSALLDLGSELVASFFIGGFLLAAITTPLTYYGIKKLVINYRNAKEHRKQKRLLKKQLKDQMK